ncbi:MAG: hypothetical protein HYX69_03390 [Planctomycetia bacterium]|nr:hypothetical protein [Planctomycetia bacterium]
MGVLVYAVDHPALPPFSMSDRFRHEVAYFMHIPGDTGHPKLPDGEYWIDPAQARSWYEDGCIALVSPLDSQNKTEVELSEEQENWLAWMLAHEVAHIRLA